ncbi:MAG: ferrous iron transport protein B, partial [Vicinamibacteria bacterium]
MERRSARLAIDGHAGVELVDLPGTYSLSARSHEEQIAVDALTGRGTPPPAAVVVVADATALARALYLLIEVVDTGTPVVLAVNMADEAREGGVEIDLDALSRMTGARVVATVATRGEGMDALRTAIGDAIAGRVASHTPAPLPDEVEADIAEVERAVVEAHALERHGPARAWATWLLLSLDDEGHDDLAAIPQSVREATRRVRARAAAAGRDLDLEIIGARYRRVDAVCAAALRRTREDAHAWTDRLDAVLTHRVAGTAVFAVVMMVVFQALFSWSEPAIAIIEDAVGALQGLVTDALPPGAFTSLLVDGVIAGVGNVVVFVPQIALLFLFIGLLEDLGYLARVAFVIDRLMKGVGLHGRAFVPMLSGFSCAVPAVMATRTIENRTDRLLTMMVLPLMSCSARLPVYVLITATVFAPGSTVGFLSTGAVVLFSMYMLSVVAALGAAAVLRRTLLQGPRTALVMELPPYRLPAPLVLLEGVWRRVRTFLVDAGTIILALTIVLWALLSYPKSAEVEADFDARVAAVETLPDEAREARVAEIEGQRAGEQLRMSVAGRAGRIIEPLIEPLGFDWRIGVGILGAFAAREVFVSTLGIVFDITEADEASEPLRQALATATRRDGTPLMTPASGLAL